MAGCHELFAGSYLGPDAPPGDTSSNMVDATEADCLRDDFNAGEIDTKRWRLLDPDNTPVSIEVHSARLVIVMPAVGGTNALISRHPRDATGADAIVRVQREASSATETELALRNTAGAAYWIRVASGYISFGFDGTAPVSQPYNPDTMVFWRIYFALIDGVDAVRFQTSQDGLTWTNHHGGPVTIPPGDMEVWLAGSGAQDAAMVAAFDDFQLNVPGCPRI